VTLPLLGDRVGRVPVFLVTMFCQIPLLVILLLADNIGYVYYVIFFYGIGSIGRYTTGFIILNELVPRANKSIAGSLFNVGDSMATIYVTAYLVFISTKTLPILWVALVCNILAFVVSFIVLPESPAWLIS
jgi:MFS transporter, OCT family, solute carrier family 22 (organic cation transporter), member 4/5